MTELAEMKAMNKKGLLHVTGQSLEKFAGFTSASTRLQNFPRRNPSIWESLQGLPYCNVGGMNASKEYHGNLGLSGWFRS